MIYELAVLGTATAQQLAELREHVSQALAAFELELERDVGWQVGENQFRPHDQFASAAVYFGAPGSTAPRVPPAVPIVPVASSLAAVAIEIPAELRALNCLGLAETSLARVATTLLECAGLMPRQRRVFLSYRRDEARLAALQLFNSLSARQYDVFLDTHGVPPAADFQATLWHRLCESDVLVMLDTPTYFTSRWTAAEFGRAQAKNIGVLRVGWPDSTPSIRTQTVSRAELIAEEVDDVTGGLTEPAIDRICTHVEQVRSESVAVRRVQLTGHVRNGMQKIGGEFLGIGSRGAIHVRLPDGRLVTLYPALGVPTSRDLHGASNDGNGVAGVVYDEVGLLPEWQEHMDWLGRSIRSAVWVKVHRVGYDLADWDPPP